MKFLINFFLIIFSFLISNKLIQLFILNLRDKFIDLPNFRSMHLIPTPRGGGIVFAFITIFASLFYLIIYGYSNIYIIPVLCIPLVLIGILDDLFKLSSFLRYFFHIITSSSILLASNLFAIINTEELFLKLLIFIFITFIFTAMINFMNFMDGIDGLVGGSLFVSIISCCIFLKIGQPYLFLASSLAAFIIWNWRPAKIFMGDTGSTFLAAVNIGLISLSNNLSDAIGLTLILTPCLVDPFVCVIRRYFDNQNIFEPHCLHLYQRLKQNGIKEAYISLIYIFLTLLLSIIFLNFGLLATFTMSIIIVMVGFYLDQNIALSFNLSKKECLKKIDEEINFEKNKSIFSNIIKISRFENNL